MIVTVTFQVACGDAGLDGGVQTVESTTELALCGVTGPQTWRSSGSTCIQCCVVCEMAPTPIVSDNMGDDLPLARALRLRVIEVARAGKRSSSSRRTTPATTRSTTGASPADRSSASPTT